MKDASPMRLANPLSQVGLPVVLGYRPTNMHMCTYKTQVNLSVLTLVLYMLFPAQICVASE